MHKHTCSFFVFYVVATREAGARTTDNAAANHTTSNDPTAKNFVENIFIHFNEAIILPEKIKAPTKRGELRTLRGYPEKLFRFASEGGI